MTLTSQEIRSTQMQYFKEYIRNIYVKESISGSNAVNPLQQRIQKHRLFETNNVQLQ